MRGGGGDSAASEAGGAFSKWQRRRWVSSISIGCSATAVAAEGYAEVSSGVGGRSSNQGGSSGVRWAAVSGKHVWTRRAVDVGLQQTYAVTFADVSCIKTGQISMLDIASHHHFVLSGVVAGPCVGLPSF